ncbi:hypothetical protein [Spongiimicrobium salis]|uniref:hypothetical protein n=1 Tax=Spongiimicrobium salis TaxID=1667022 RepID=UPI00374D3E01
MKAEFTDIEKEILKGKKLAIAKKYGCSHTYVNSIVEGDVELTSALSLKIYNGIKETIRFFMPMS